MNWYLKVLKQYADFKGRARRQEYWMFVLFNLLFILGLGAIIDLIPYALYFLVLYVFAILIPLIAVSVRILHDTGKSGWWYLMGFVPIASIILLVFFCMDSDPGENKWGPNPKGEGNNKAINQIGTE
ncbi:MAG: DUF805 domain-containing protein [Polaribacter sp.]